LALVSVIEFPSVRKLHDFTFMTMNMMQPGDLAIAGGRVLWTAQARETVQII
jgi:hypothetical protein